MAGTVDLVAAYAELCAARPKYAKAEAFYDGDVDELFASDKVAKMLAKSHLNELEEVNFARIPVDAVANKLRIAAVTTDTPTADEDLAELIRRNQLKLEAPALHTRACSQGDAYLMVWPETDDDGTITGVNMFVNSAAIVRVIYDEENPLLARYVIKTWTVGAGKDQVTRADLYYRDRIERWLWAGKHSDKQDKWEPWSGDGQDAVLDNPYGELPFFHFRTARPYGRPEHYAAYGPQSIINKIVVSHAATIDFQSLPQRYGLIDPAVDQSGAQSDFDPDRPEDVEADPESPNHMSQLRSDPGEFWQLQGYRQVGQFDAANPAVYMGPFDRYIKAMAQVTDTPFTAFDSTGDAISGESRREANAPMIAKVEARQESFGSSWIPAYTFALRLLGHEDVVVDVRWQPAEQVSDLDGWAIVKAKVEAGVPRERALVEAGYPPEQVAGWLQALDDDAELGRRAALLLQIGNAVQALGTGVQLGSVTSDQVGVLLDTMLGAAANLGTAEANQ